MKSPTCLAQGAARVSCRGGRAPVDRRTPTPRDVPAESLPPIRAPSQSHDGNIRCLPAAFSTKKSERIYILCCCPCPPEARWQQSRLPPRASVFALFNPRARRDCFCKYSPAVCFCVGASRVIMHAWAPELRSNGALCRGESSCAAFNWLVFHTLVMSHSHFHLDHEKARSQLDPAE